MRIASSDVQLTSAHQATVRSEARERLQFVRGGRTQVEPETDRPVESAERPAHSVNISTQARRMSERALESTLNTVRGPQPGARPTTAPITATTDEEDSKEPEIGDLRSQLVRALFERLTGRKMEIEALDTSPPETTAPPLTGSPPPGQAPPPGEVVEASGFSYERTETYEETEEVVKIMSISRHRLEQGAGGGGAEFARRRARGQSGPYPAPEVRAVVAAVVPPGQGARATRRGARSVGRGRRIPGAVRRGPRLRGSDGQRGRR